MPLLSTREENVNFLKLSIREILDIKVRGSWKIPRKTTNQMQPVSINLLALQEQLLISKKTGNFIRLVFKLIFVNFPIVMKMEMMEFTFSRWNEVSLSFASHI